MGHPSIDAPEYAAAEIEKLVRSAQKGDEGALSLLIQKTQKNLYRFCCYLASNESLAQDLCQDAYIKALENIGRLKKPDKFLSWLFTTAKNLFLDHQRSPATQRAEPLDSVENSVAQAPKTDLRIQIQETLDKLPADERLVLLLVDLEGYSYSEAAEILGISEDAVRSRLHKARKLFANTYF
jgi:RNA polymerase sigma-70 factor, ECF subfamily